MEELTLVDDAARFAGSVSGSLLLRDDGTVAVCGRNGNGQLGMGDCTNRKRFVPVPNVTSVVEVASGDYFSFLRFQDGTIAACGSNVYGQLGTG